MTSALHRQGRQGRHPALHPATCVDHHPRVRKPVRRVSSDSSGRDGGGGSTRGRQAQLLRRLLPLLVIEGLAVVFIHSGGPTEDRAGAGRHGPDNGEDQRVGCNPLRVPSAGAPFTQFHRNDRACFREEGRLLGGEAAGQCGGPHVLRLSTEERERGKERVCMCERLILT